MRLFFVVFLSGWSLPAQTPTLEKVNQELPRWLKFSGEARSRFEGFEAGAFLPGNDDFYLLNRVRFDMALIPRQWLKFQFETQNAWVAWKSLRPYGPPFQDTWDLRFAYVELGHSEKSALLVGRQGLSYGEERLIGNTNWSNTARSFDAIRGIIRRGRFRLDVFAASVVILRDGQVGEHSGGNNIHGLYGGIDRLVPEATIEPYLFWRLLRGSRTEQGTVASLDSKTAGVRWLGKLPRGFDYNVDMAVQRGSVGADRVAAWAGHWVVGRTFANLAWKPRLMAEYNYASGDADPKDGKIGTFDQLYPTAHDKYGLADQVGWKNIRHIRTGIELKPIPKLATSTKYNSYWLADPHDALYSLQSVAIVRRADGTAGRFVGQAIDASALYTWSKELQIGGGISHFFTGTFLENTGRRHGYTGPYLFVNYTY